jgi:hypothetical protein
VATESGHPSATSPATSPQFLTPAADLAASAAAAGDANATDTANTAAATGVETEKASA